TADDLIRWTDGRALVATGSPFAPVPYGGRQIPIAQCNNIYIFPATGLGVVASRARRVTDAMILAAARALGEKSPALTDPSASLVPALPQLREVAAHIATAVGRQAQRDGVAPKMSDAVDIDPAGKRVVLADGAAFEYDSLIVAAGSQTSYYGHDVWQQWAPGMKSIEEATNIRHKILYAFEAAERLTDPAERQAWLRFVIVGAGATGVELAGAIGEIARQTLKNDFRAIRSQDAEIILLDGAPRVLMTFPEDLAQKATESLARLGVRVKTGVMVKNIDHDGVTVESHGVTDRLESK